MRRVIRTPPILFCLLTAGCVTLPQLPEGQSYPAVVNPVDVFAKQPVAAPKDKIDPAVTMALIELLESKDRFRVDLTQAQDTPFAQILGVGSPIGYELRTRFLNLSIPLTEALTRNNDPALREKLVTVARWDSNEETRADALVALAGAHDVKDYDAFREALIHLDPAVRFGALEALTVWGNQDKSRVLLANSADRDMEPILRLYAAAGLARLGDASGTERLRKALDDPNWLVRSMAARYLGEFGTAEDYKLLTSRIGQEAGNDFVIAEYCIAALKLFPKVPA
jgi:HEAT repeat protein